MKEKMHFQSKEKWPAAGEIFESWFLPILPQKGFSFFKIQQPLTSDLKSSTPLPEGARGIEAMIILRCVINSTNC